jgi:uncharacterized oxidoreductase
VLDIGSAAAIGPFVEELILRRPTLNVVIHSAGIMRYERVTKASFSTDVTEATITTNLLGTIRLTTALLPHFLSRPEATIVTISSGLAFVPLAMTPTYCATKAAIHSYSQSLRYQLKDTNVRVVEIAPPYVQSELMGVQQASDPMAMPLNDFIAETMAISRSQPRRNRGAGRARQAAALCRGARRIQRVLRCLQLSGDGRARDRMVTMVERQ